MDIRKILAETPVVVAPLAGVTDLPFRLILRQFHKGLSYAEMISSQSIVRVRSKELYRREISSEDTPTTFQLLGRDPEYMSAAAHILEDMGAEIIDINMGCSVRKVLKQKEGSALIAEPDLACRIMERVASSVKVPVTLKIRKSSGKFSSVEIVRRATDCGMQAVAVHGRTAEQLYSGVADWNYISSLREFTSLPLIGNGDIRTPEDAVSRMAESGVDAVMIGRALMGHPTLLPSCAARIQGVTFSEPFFSERLAIGWKHLLIAEQIEGEYEAFKKMRKHLAWYVKSAPMSSAFRGLIFKTASISDMKRVWQAYSNFVSEEERSETHGFGATAALYKQYMDDLL